MGYSGMNIVGYHRYSGMTIVGHDGLFKYEHCRI